MSLAMDRYLKQLTFLLRLTVLLVFFLASQSSWGNFPNLIPNPDFAEIHDGDSITHYWEKKTRGENAQLTLEYEGHGDKSSISILGKGIWQCKIRAIKPYQYYFFSFWIKRDGWREGEYPTINIFDHAIYLNELFSWGGWLKLSWFLDSTRYKSANLLLINPGMTHKLWFDDFFLTEFRVQS